MSDFDKEAEREKLREKYEADEQERQHTKRLSDLLLKGATMTNQHCSQCGDPIFRHEGQEFCPSCGTGRGDDATGGDETRTGGDAANGTARPEGATADDTAAGSAPTGSTAASVTADDADRTGEPRGNAPATRGPTSARGSTPARGSTRGPNVVEEPDAASEAAGDAPAELGAARASLARTVAKFARAAEATDDPGRARDHLKAAREAAEAVDALERRGER